METEEEMCVAWLHDVLEDTPLLSLDLSLCGMPDSVIEAVRALTKINHQPYEMYLEGVKLNPLALKVKLADIRDNLADSPTEHQRDKYAKALQFLKGVEHDR